MQICVKPNFHSARNQTDQTRADQTSPVLQGWVYHSFGISFAYLSNQVLLVSKYPIWHSCSKKQSNASISEEMDFTWAEVTISTKCTLQQLEHKTPCTLFLNRPVPSHADAKATCAGAKTRATAKIKTLSKAQQTRGLSSA